MNESFRISKKKRGQLPGDRDLHREEDGPGKNIWHRVVYVCVKSYVIRQRAFQKKLQMSSSASGAQDCATLILWEQESFLPFAYLCVWNSPFWLYFKQIRCTKCADAEIEPCFETLQSHFVLGKWSSMASLGTQEQGP